MERRPLRLSRALCLMEPPINVHQYEWKLNIASRHHSCKQPCTADLPSVQSRSSGPRKLVLPRMEDATMSRVKQASTKKRVTKAALPALGAAGLTFSLTGGASASAVPIPDVQQTTNLAPNLALTLGEEEIADVSLATFHVFDNENVGSGVQVAWRGCGGCRGCRGCRCAGCRACRGCGGACGCGVACGSCCASWGVCRFC